MKDTYQTIKTPTIGEYKAKGSKFIAYAFSVQNKQAIKDCLEEVRKEHNKARHHCYGYRLGLGKDKYRANDDSEPSGTAGRPILGQIDSFGLSHVLIVVVRYFGGTKLGTSGLKTAYKAAAMEALQDAVIIEKIVKEEFLLTYSYAATVDVMNYVNGIEIDIKNTKYTNDKSMMTVAIRLREIENFTTAIAAIDGVKCDQLLS